MYPAVVTHICKSGKLVSSTTRYTTSNHPAPLIIISIVVVHCNKTAAHSHAHSCLCSVTQSSAPTLRLAILTGTSFPYLIHKVVDLTLSADKMQFSASVTLSLLPLLGTTDAGWREDCNFSGNGQFHIIRGAPFLSTFCTSSSGRQICTMLDLSHCYMNTRGHLVNTLSMPPVISSVLPFP